MALEPRKRRPQLYAPLLTAQLPAAYRYDILVKPDVRVTNQKDKEVQLPKLKSLNEFAKRAAADFAADFAADVTAPDHAWVDPFAGDAAADLALLPSRTSTQ